MSSVLKCECGSSISGSSIICKNGIEGTDSDLHFFKCERYYYGCPIRLSISSCSMGAYILDGLDSMSYTLDNGIGYESVKFYRTFQSKFVCEYLECQYYVLGSQPITSKLLLNKAPKIEIENDRLGLRNLTNKIKNLVLLS